MRDIFVVSDLHIGRGKNPETGRYSNLEAFFYDEDFLGLCRHLCAKARERGPFLLILNGDVFDILRSESQPLREPGPLERWFGPVPTPPLAARLMRQILAGHSSFVAGLAHVVENGSEVLVLPGNHDIETQWEPVRAEIRAAVAASVRARSGEDVVAPALERLRFGDWYYYEPGRVWIEHGSQYDDEASFRYYLRGALADRPDALHEAEQDLPLASFFQRYLYNAFGPITFVVPSSRANFRYFRWMLVNEPRLLGRVLLRHLPFLLQILKRVSLLTQGAARRELAKAHERRLAELAAESGLGDRLRHVEGLKHVRADVYIAVRSLLMQFLKFVVIGVGVASLAIGLFVAGSSTIAALGAGFGWKLLLFLLLSFVLLLTSGAGIGWALLRVSPAVPRAPLKQAAREIAAVLDVPIVGFGHTHDEGIWRIDRAADRPSWYHNTGTWIAVFTHDVMVPRERVQYTVLRIREREAELLRWSPGRGATVPVVLLDEPDPEGLASLLKLE